MARISGPLLDRFDMRIEMTRVPTEQLLRRRPSEPSAIVRARIAAAREYALARNGGLPNAQLTGASVVAACALSPADRTDLSDFARRSRLTARGIHRVLRVARSIADLDGRVSVSLDDVYAAARLREPADTASAQAA